MRARSISLLLLWVGCREEREPARAVELASVQTVLTTCARCHGGDTAPADFRTTSYQEALGCIDGGAAVLPSDGRAPVIAVLARADHAALLSPDQREALLRWVEAGAPGRNGAVHGAHALDPRSDEWHGKRAAERRFEPLREPESSDACGRCHDGAPARPQAVRFAAPGAPACTSCHTQPASVLACGTCHGNGERAYPPRDPCFFTTSAGGAHAAHVTSTRFRERALDCAACHPVPGALQLFAGDHTNGTVDVRFASPATAAGGSYDAATQGCTVPCHGRGGRHADLTWQADLTLDCNSCHLSPPPAHYPGPCATCHLEMGATAESLRPGPLHLNGKVDVGSGGEGCGACHGEGSDPWPRDTLHTSHRFTRLTSPIACDGCHLVPSTRDAPLHLDGHVDVRLSGRALFANGTPSFDAQTKRCQAVACHGGPLAGASSAPSWQTPASTLGCASCHAAPPPPPHVQLPSCGGSLCHGEEVGGSAPQLGISESGKSVHVDGIVQAGSSR